MGRKPHGAPMSQTGKSVQDIYEIIGGVGDEVQAMDYCRYY